MSVAEIAITPATRRDALELAPHLRRADREEVWASGRLSGESALLLSLLHSAPGLAWAGRIDGEIAVLFGVAQLSLLSDEGRPWLLASLLMERHPLALLRNSRRYVALMRAPFTRLMNHVDARNHAARRWLAWLGFTLEPPAPHGAAGLPFHQFHMPGLSIPAARQCDHDEPSRSLNNV
jgi:hypothetical protein